MVASKMIVLCSAVVVFLSITKVTPVHGFLQDILEGKDTVHKPPPGHYIQVFRKTLPIHQTTFVTSYPQLNGGILKSPFTLPAVSGSNFGGYVSQETSPPGIQFGNPLLGDTNPKPSGSDSAPSHDIFNSQVFGSSPQNPLSGVPTQDLNSLGGRKFVPSSPDSPNNYSPSGSKPGDVFNIGGSLNGALYNSPDSTLNGFGSIHFSPYGPNPSGPGSQYFGQYPNSKPSLPGSVPFDSLFTMPGYGNFPSSNPSEPGSQYFGQYPNSKPSVPGSVPFDSLFTMPGYGSFPSSNPSGPGSQYFSHYPNSKPSGSESVPTDRFVNGKLIGSNPTGPASQYPESNPSGSVLSEPFGFKLSELSGQYPGSQLFGSFSGQYPGSKPSGSGSVSSSPFGTEPSIAPLTPNFQYFDPLSGQFVGSKPSGFGSVSSSSFGFPLSEQYPSSKSSGPGSPYSSSFGSILSSPLIGSSISYGPGFMLKGSESQYPIYMGSQYGTNFVKHHNPSFGVVSTNVHYPTSYPGGYTVSSSYPGGYSSNGVQPQVVFSDEASFKSLNEEAPSASPAASPSIASRIESDDASKPVDSISPETDKSNVQN